MQNVEYLLTITKRCNCWIALDCSFVHWPFIRKIGLFFNETVCCG